MLIFGSFQNKLIFYLAIIIASISLFIFFYFPSRFEDEQKTAIKNKVEDLVDITTYSIGAAIEFEDFDAIQEGVNPILHDENLIYLVIYSLPSNTISYEYNYQLAKSYNFNSALEQNRFTDDEHIYHTRSVIWFNNRKVGNIYFGYSFESMHQNVNEIKLNIFYISSLVFLVGLIIAWRLGKVLTNPLLQVSETVKRITDGDLTQRAPVLSNDEIGRLAQSFNEMTNQLISANNQLAKINFDLEKRVEERTSELRKAKEEAESSERMKTSFLAQMSHEIRTPVNTILNFISLVKEEVKELEMPELIDYFNSIENGSYRLINTIDSILNMSQLKAGNYDANFTNIELYKEVLDGLYKEFHHSAGLKNIKFELKNEIADPIVYADLYSLTQLIANLIHNSIKYTLSGKIILSVSELNSKHLLISLEDTGIGMSKEYLNNIFQPFTQEETGYTRKFEGTGLGLALVYNYCELNSIKINVESKKNEGTKFTLKIRKGKLKS